MNKIIMFLLILIAIFVFMNKGFTIDSHSDFVYDGSPDPDVSIDDFDISSLPGSFCSFKGYDFLIESYSYNDCFSLGFNCDWWNNDGGYCCCYK
jgi:hypothetical protein